ncbi:hypothetical protein BpHYR1_048147 [Brachionus plicatilis]|uniref:Uncharacterized protein n=1 Tax=Brachionus plicatilis TaxID=10195 RepID=A0A3M7T0C2_BRAPC|nr:hypothetical protein BpHYR1_048147 [Brachionus plicatilis]
MSLIQHLKVGKLKDVSWVAVLGRSVQEGRSRPSKRPVYWTVRLQMIGPIQTDTNCVAPLKEIPNQRLTFEQNSFVEGTLIFVDETAVRICHQELFRWRLDVEIFSKNF